MQSKTYKNFEITKEVEIKEINSKLIELQHINSGATIIHIENDDDENLFSLCFQTFPFDSSGVAHILEHTVLCGSKKFPVKDPFFSMMRRSLNTFMNAMTGADFTCYPASSQVEKDFYNLYDVYLDAVFNPELKYLSFLQEGHRLEFQNPKNVKESALLFKGIVFNEMKGVLSTPDSRMLQSMLKNLFPDLPYAYNVGGDPKDIPNLTYEQFKDFHKKYYDPSRCVFFTYGNISLKKHLDFLEKRVLKDTLKKEPLPAIPKQKRFTEPKHIVEKYPISANEDLSDKTFFCFSYLTCPIANELEALAISLLDSILMDTDASLLKRDLLASKLLVQTDSLIDTDVSEIPWLFVFKGCKKENFEKILKVFNDSLKKISETKIEKVLIEAALHQLEFSRMEIRADGSPYGLSLFFRSVLQKLHGCDVVNSLKIHSLFKELEKLLDDDNYLPSLIKKYLLDNPHSVFIKTSPDVNLEKQELEEEKERLIKIKEKLSKEEIEKILTNTQKLKDYQEKISHQSLDCLPIIKMEEIPKKIKTFPLHVETINDFKIYSHDVFTNGVLYADIMFPLGELSKEEMKMLPMLTWIVTEIGAGKSYLETLFDMQLHTGGISSNIYLNTKVDDIDNIDPCFSIKGKALFRNAEHFFKIIKDLITKPNFDEKDRIKELILQMYTSLNDRINSNAMRYAINQSISGLNVASYLNNLFNGIEFYNLVKEIALSIDKNLDKIILDLKNLTNKIFSRKGIEIIISAKEDFTKKLIKNSFYGLTDVKLVETKPFNKEIDFEKTKHQGRIIASPISFNSLGFEAINYSDKLSPYILLSTFLFENIVLHTAIREKGGAYGSGAQVYFGLGNIVFTSLRDPHISDTLKAFYLSVKEIAHGNFSDQDLYESKLGAIQEIDNPISPGSRALLAYLWKKNHKTNEMRQNFRNKLLSATKEDIINAIEKIILPKMDSANFVSYASKEMLESANQYLDKKLDIFSV